jgi:hypothetical protein
MTAQTLQGAVTAVASVVASVTGVNSSTAYPQFNISDRIFALNYVMSSVVEISETGTKQHLATISSDLLTPFVDVLNEDIETILGLVDSISTALITEATSGGDMFSAAIDTYSNLRIEFLPAYFYAGIQHIGYRIMLEDVKLKLDL